MMTEKMLALTEILSPATGTNHRVSLCRTVAVVGRAKGKKLEKKKLATISINGQFSTAIFYAPLLTVPTLLAIVCKV